MVETEATTTSTSTPNSFRVFSAGSSMGQSELLPIIMATFFIFIPFSRIPNHTPCTAPNRAQHFCFIILGIRNRPYRNVKFFIIILPICRNSVNQIVANVTLLLYCFKSKNTGITPVHPAMHRLGASVFSCYGLKNSSPVSFSFFCNPFINFGPGSTFS